MTHELKILKEYFNEVFNENKTFEIRKNDRDYKVGDILILKEWDSKNKVFTGQKVIRVVAHIMKENYGGLKKGYVILSIK